MSPAGRTDTTWSSSAPRSAAISLATSVFFLLPMYLAIELHAGPRAIGQVTAAAMVAGVLITPLLGPLIDRGRRRRLVIVGSVAMVAGSLGFVWVDAVGPYVMGLRILQGIAFTVAFNTVATLVTDLSPPPPNGILSLA